MPFETQLKRLENIVQQLEGGDVALEQALSLYEEGVRLTKECALQLEDVQRKIEQLVKDSTKKIRAKPFDVKERRSV